jgi:hypothetical protein
MAEAPRPPTTQAAEPPQSTMNQLSLEDGNHSKAVVPHEGSKENAGALTVANNNVSPVSPDEKRVAKISPGKRGSNLKAEAFAVAHSKRVEHEAHSYIDAEARKAEAHAEKLKVGCVRSLRTYVCLDGILPFCMAPTCKWRDGEI